MSGLAKEVVSLYRFSGPSGHGVEVMSLNRFSRPAGLGIQVSLNRFLRDQLD